MSDFSNTPDVMSEAESASLKNDLLHIAVRDCNYGIMSIDVYTLGHNSPHKKKDERLIMAAEKYDRLGKVDAAYDQNGRVVVIIDPAGGKRDPESERARFKEMVTHLKMARGDVDGRGSMQTAKYFGKLDDSNPALTEEKLSDPENVLPNIAFAGLDSVLIPKDDIKVIAEFYDTISNFIARLDPDWVNQYPDNIGDGHLWLEKNAPDFMEIYNRIRNLCRGYIYPGKHYSESNYDNHENGADNIADD